MLRFAADENFVEAISEGLRLRLPAIDLLRVQDTDWRGANDPLVLAWAATEGRVLLTHDVSTLVPDAYERIGRGEPMTGVVAVPNTLPIGAVIEDLVVIALCSELADWQDRVEFLPL